MHSLRVEATKTGGVEMTDELQIDPEELLQVVTLDETLFLWMVVHGHLCLALRHPAVQGPSRKYAERFVDKLGDLLMERGVFTRQQINDAMGLEAIERARQRN